MDWRVLGPLEVWADGSPVKLGGRQRHLVLAILLVNANQTISTDRLVDEVWGESPPDSARKTIQAHVAHLRRVINVDGEVLASAGNGYRITPDPERLDAHRFEAAVDEAREVADSEPERSVEILDEALALFRGEPYAGLADDALGVKVESSRLGELRLSAQEERLEALLTVGEGGTVAADAEVLLAEHPLRERLWAFRMLALYRVGRQSEALGAYSRARQTLAEELGIEPSGELQALEQQILEQDPHLEDSILTTSTPAVTVQVKRNPYKGLRAFDEADSADFFGRSDLTRQLVDRLTARPPSHLTILAGPSGAGKSSVLRAGLIPRLRDLGLVVAVMYPGDDPVAGLEEARREGLAESDEDTRSKGLDVVAVDQFEELFILAGDDRAGEFIDRMIRDTADPTRWVATVRADFLDRLLAHPRLGRVLGESLVLVPPLEDQEVEAVIVEPARRVRVDVEPALVAAMVSDVQARASALPLLQYALTDLFDHRRSDLLTVDAYRRSGGLSGALVRRADQVFGRLDDERQKTAQRVFLQLVAVTDTGEFARRRVQRSTLEQDHRSVDAILERFGAQRLLTFDQDPESGQPTVEVAHESLLVAWPRLARWVDDAREDLQMRAGLNTALAEWEANNRDPGFLLTGGRLAQHQTWTTDTSLGLTEAEQEYLDQSTTHAEATRQRRRRRRSWIMAGFGFAAIIATIFGLVAVNNAREAEARGLIANASAVMDEDSNLALLLALQGASDLEDDASAVRVLRTAIANANILHVESISERPFLPGELSPTGREMIVRRGSSVELIDIESKTTVWTFETEMPDSGFLQPVQVNDGREVAVVGLWIPNQEEDPFAAPPEGAAVHILDAGTGELLRRHDIGTCGGELLQAEGTKLLYFSPTEQWYETNGCAASDAGPPPGRVSLLDTSSGQSSVLAPEPVPLTFLPFGPFGGFALSESAGGLLVWDGGARTAVVEDLATGVRLGEIDQAPRTALVLALAPDASTAVIGGAPDADSRVLHVYDVASGEEVGTLDGHAGPTRTMEFLDDGERLITAGEDGLVKIWSMSSLQLLDTFTLGGPQFSLSMSADEGRVGLVGLAAITAMSIDPDEVAEVGAYDACPTEPAFFHGASLVVRGELMLVRQGCGPEIVDFDGGRGHVFDLVGGGLVGSGPLGASQGVDLSPDGRFVASQRFDPETAMFGSVVVTELASGAEVEMEGLCEWSFEGPGEECEAPPELPFPMEVWDLDFSPDGELLMASNRQWGEPGVIWETATGALVATWDSASAGFAPTGARIVTLDPGSGTLESWSTEDFSLIESRELRSDQITDGYFDVAADGRIVGATATPELVFFDGETLEEIERWSGLHEALIRDIAFSGDGSMIATASFDGFVKVWDMETGDLLHEIQVSEDDRVQSVAFANDDRHLWVSAEFGPLAGYTLDIDELLDIARDRLIRGFTDAECAQYFPDGGCPTLEEMGAG